MNHLICFDMRVNNSMEFMSNNKIQRTSNTEFDIVLINSMDNHDFTEEYTPQYITEEMSLNRLFEVVKAETLKNKSKNLRPKT